MPPSQTEKPVHGYFGWLETTGISVAEHAIADFTHGLRPEEYRCIGNAVMKRRLEFSTGRHLARMAMIRLDQVPCQIPVGRDREPRWPAELAGSITHTDLWCAVSIALRSEGVASIGIDLETAEPLPHDLIDVVCTRQERLDLVAAAADARGLLAKCLFSAKESVYKAQHPMTGCFLEMHDAEVHLDLARQQFTATLQRAAADFPTGHRFEGQIRLSDGHIATAVVMRRR